MLGQQLRTQAAEMRQAVSELRATGNTAASVRAQLTGLLGLTSVEDMQTRLSQIIESMPSDAFETRITTTIVGTVTANVYDALADMTDGMDGLRAIGGMSDRRRALMDINTKLNRAAASGDWDEFERIAGRLAGGSGGDSAEGTGSEAEDPGSNGDEGQAVS